MSRILIVEDEPRIVAFLTKGLKAAGFTTHTTAEGGQAVALAVQEDFDLIILDVGLPDIDGFEVLQQLRGQGVGTPVIMLTARSSVADRVAGLEGGADDYMTKPFGVMELISRVKALLRRAGGEEKLLSCGEVVMDETARRVTVGGEPCELTYKEYELLKYMLANAGLVLRREAILERVWGTDYEGESRTLDMHIKTLRQKLGSAGAHIRTVRSVGYSFEKEQTP